MSAKMQVPLSQRRHTNIAVVRFSRNGVKLEIACYKNKVISYRSGIENRLDEVLQVDRIFSHVGRGLVASEKDIQAVFGNEMSEEEAIRYMLEHGELQVAQQERTAEIDEMFKDISVIISQKCINEATQRPFPSQVIEQSLRSIGAAVKLDQTVKKQALALMHQLIESQIIPIARAKMKVRCTVATEEARQLVVDWCQSNGADIVPEPIDVGVKEETPSASRHDSVVAPTSSSHSVLALLPPHLFREMEQFVKLSLQSGAALHMVDTAATDREGVGNANTLGDDHARSNTTLSDNGESEDERTRGRKKGIKKTNKKSYRETSKREEEEPQTKDLGLVLEHLDKESDSDDGGKKSRKSTKKKKKGLSTNSQVPAFQKLTQEEGGAEEDSDAEVEGNRKQRKKMNFKKVQNDFSDGDVWDEEWEEE